MSAGDSARSKLPPRLAQRFLAGVVLYGLWVLLSGKTDAFHLGVGAVAVVGVLWMHTRLPEIEPEAHRVLGPVRFVVYFFWLVGQMLISAMHVAKVILRPGAHPPEPRLVAFASPQPSLVQGVLFANSITLTPGTLTLDYQDGRYLVHALTEDTASGVLSGDMAGRVARLSGPADGPFVEAFSADEWRLKT